MLLSSRGSFSEELCLECGSYSVRADDTMSEVSWTQEVHDDSTVLSHCENSMACHVEVGSYLNVAVHAEDGFHHGDWADEVSWKLYYKETNQLLLRGGSPYAASVCLPRGQHTLVQIDDWSDGWHNVFFSSSNRDQGQMTKCGLADETYIGFCSINANTCLPHSISSTQQSPLNLLRDESVVWSGTNGEVCLLCGEYELSDVTESVEVMDSETSQSIRTCMWCSSASLSHVFTRLAIVLISIICIVSEENHSNTQRSNAHSNVT